jgi:DNA-binding beta-propeller fold protein YncE
MRALLLLAALFLFLSAPLHAQQEIESARRTVAAVEKLLKDRPDDPTLWFYLARFRAVAGDRAGSLAALEKLLEIGEGFLPTADGFMGFGQVGQDPAFHALRTKFEAKLPRLDYAPTAFEIEDRTLVPEGIAYDAHQQAFYVGSIHHGTIVRVDSRNSASPFAGPEGLDAILGIAVDTPRRILYAVSTSALTRAGEAKRRNAVVAFDVDSGKRLRSIEIPEALQLNDVAVALGGRVFATDSQSGAIYEIPKTGPARAVVGPNVLRGSNGLAPSPDGKRLHVAHSTGIAVVEIATGAVKRVAVPERQTVAGIDGLYEWQGQLVGVQNVTTPGRVILMTLSSDGASVTRVQTLVSHHHTALYEPTTGVVTDRGFFLLAATGVSHFNREGKLDREDAIPKPLVLRVPLPR